MSWNGREWGCSWEEEICESWKRGEGWVMMCWICNDSFQQIQITKIVSDVGGMSPSTSFWCAALRQLRFPSS